MICIVRPSVCRMRISLKLSKIESLLSDLRSEVVFGHFGCFQVTFFDKLYIIDSTTLGAMASQLSSHPITDDTLFILVLIICWHAVFTLSHVSLCETVHYLYRSDWYGMLYSFADSKKKSNLMLSIFEPGDFCSLGVWFISWVILQTVVPN